MVTLVVSHQEMNEPIFVSLHIPKTAGMTLLHILVDIYGDRLQRAYQPPRAGVEPSETDGWPDITDPACIHGHGVIKRFPWVLRVPDARWITFLREPLARAVSMFRFRQRYRPWDSTVDSEPPPEDLATFLLEQHDHNAYAQWFAKSGRSPNDFFFVGISERFDDSIVVLSRMMGWQGPQYSSKNRSPGPAPSVSSDVAKRFREVNSEDCDIYAKAKEAFEARYTGIENG